MITPVKVDIYQQLLHKSGYDPKETAFLVDGFQNGFPLCYKGNHKIKMKSPNLKLTIGDEIDLWNKVMKEVKLKRYACPFREVPFQYFIQSPIGLVPKDGGRDTRLIFHLSHPQRKSQKLSVNANIPVDLCLVKYPDFSEAVKLLFTEGIGCSAGKSDMKSVFRNLGMKITDFCWLVMAAKNPINGQWQYFVDKCLPFGSSISCTHFQRFSNSIAHLVKYRTGKRPINYLDDYLFAALRKLWSDNLINAFIEICSQISFPIAFEKTEWGSTLVIFLGLLLDTINQVVCIPVEKIDKGRILINTILSQKKVTVKLIQQVCGFLNFLCRCVVPGRAFTQRLYSYTSSKDGNKQLLPHHHVRVTAEMKSDLLTWSKFLDHPSVFCRPFLDFNGYLNASEVNFYTDSSGNARLGMGDLCSSSWFMQQWNYNFVSKVEPSIEILELLAVTAGILLWICRFANKRIVIFCDNISVVYMISKSMSGCKNCMVLIRFITLECLVHNVRVYAKYVKSSENSLADALSRRKVQLFTQLVRETGLDIEKSSTPIPDSIWPIEKIWLY